MRHPLFHHIRRYAPMPEADFPAILAAFHTVKVKKKQHLMKAGQICDANFFVVTGCLNMYTVDDSGAKQTIQFAIENWWLTDFMAFGKNSPTELSIQAVEPTEVLRITAAEQDRLLARFPYLEKYFRCIYQKAYGAALRRIRYLYEFSKKEIYFHFTEHYPEFAQRVPQYLIASFLGLTPEYVSEIRKQSAS